MKVLCLHAWTLVLSLAIQSSCFHIMMMFCISETVHCSLYTKNTLYFIVWLGNECCTFSILHSLEILFVQVPTTFSLGMIYLHIRARSNYFFNFLFASFYFGLLCFGFELERREYELCLHKNKAYSAPWLTRFGAEF